MKSITGVWSVLVCVGLCLGVPLPEADPSAGYAKDFIYYLPANDPSFHNQDVGQYSYGFESEDQTKSEIRSPDGVVRGSYSYIDTDGIVQTTNYISDALGFRVSATNLPVHNIELNSGKSAEVVSSNFNHIMVPKISYAYLPYAVGYGYGNGQYDTVGSQVQHSTFVESSPVSPHLVEAAPVAQAVTSEAIGPVASQYHSQDDGGQYSFGYDAPNSVHQETSLADGEVSGAYRYVDSNGVIQTVQYTAGVEGFKVAASNLPVHMIEQPVDTPEVAAAKVDHAKAYAQVLADIDNAAGSVIPASYVKMNHEINPVVPAVVPSSNVPVASQYHSQDDAGQYSFGYNDPNSVHQETQSADGEVAGAYRYIDSNGIIQTVQYTAGAEGFRVAASNLPVHIVELPVDTHEVAAAKIAHAQAFAAAQNFVEDKAILIASPVDTPEVAAAKIQHAEAVAAAYEAASTAFEGLFDSSSVTGEATQGVQDSYSPPADSAQYHSQDDFGQYSYGYSSPTQRKSEVKSADGITRGGYSYVDANGIVQTVNYISDAMGFRVAATNLPVHRIETPTSAVADSTVELSNLNNENQPATVPVIAPSVSYAYLPYASSYGYNLPIVSDNHVSSQAVDTAVASEPLVVSQVDYNNAQYHGQDDFGQYRYGYSSPTQTKSEVKSADGITRGGYSYVDANGIVQTVNYISDAMGFRVAATNLPVHVTEESQQNKQAADHTTQSVDQHALGFVSSELLQAEHRDTVKYANSASVVTPSVAYAYLPYAQAYGYNHQVLAQYHSQDESGQYSFGYNDANSVRQESKLAGGDVEGAYQYVDSEGIIQTVQYTAGAEGFKVGASNLPVHIVELPVDTPEVIAAKVEHAKAVAAAYAVAEAAVVDTPGVAAAIQHDAAAVEELSINLAPIDTVAAAKIQQAQAVSSAYDTSNAAYGASSNELDKYSNSAVIVEATQGVKASYSQIPTADSAQYHSQDDFGQYSYGYSSPTQTKSEVKSADGITRGGYSYVDANGIVQTVNYISDAMGFRVAATNLPVHVTEEAEETKLTEQGSSMITPNVAYSYLPYAQDFAYNLPITAA